VNNNTKKRYINRELSWLKFNERVLDQAVDNKNPLLEKIRFLSIGFTNLDEFFMVRVAGLFVQKKSQNKSIDGLTPLKQLDLISIETSRMIKQIKSIWASLLDELKKNKIHIETEFSLSKTNKKYLQDYISRSVFGILTPIIIDPSHPFPFIPNKETTLVCRLINNKKKYYGILRVPDGLEKFIRLPGKKNRFVSIETILMISLKEIFLCDTILDKGIFRPVRNSELDLGEEGEDLFLVFQKAIAERRRQEVIRIDFNEKISSHLITFIKKNLKYENENIYKLPIPIDLGTIDKLILREFKKLLYPKFKVRFPERIKDFNNDYFKAISKKDFIIHHPFESFEVVTQFIEQAADDPNVISIKHTLYRTTDDSPIEQSLIKAANKGKLVTVIIELQARFDEERNLKWARELELAGAQIIFGNIELKTHAKITLVTRKERSKIKNYMHFGTGNYHQKNATIYMDLSYFTCNEILAKDSSKIFNYLTSYSVPKGIKKITYTPILGREKFNELINKEIHHASKNKPAGFIGKMNSLVDPQLIDLFYDASLKNVKIDLIVRGICSLIPGIDNLSKNITVKSIIGRFLEHSRIYCFYNGYKFPHPKNKLYISSADLMQRNLDRRVETFIPIENETVHEQIVNQILVANLIDNANTWEMAKDGNYFKNKLSQKSKKFSSHNFFIKNPSLSGRGSAKLKSRAKVILKI